MDPNTREWTDGLFTHILRRIIDNVRGEINKRQVYYYIFLDVLLIMLEERSIRDRYIIIYS